ncbi:MAG: ABC transporter permease, partial [Bacteroidetes bacterium]|nr:ABC transporter permease [Bacteroidota bacterium]
MNKILLVIRREFLTRVRKRSFIIMTFLGPILMASVIILPIIISQVSDQQVKTVLVLDESGVFYGKFQDEDNMRFQYVVTDLETAKNNLIGSDDDALLYIPRTELNLPTSAVVYGSRQLPVSIQTYIRNVMKKEVEALKLAASGIDRDVILSAKANITLVSMLIDEEGAEEKTFTEVSMVLGIFAGLMIYMFIFIFGAQVMRGVIEEKSNRIVEIIVSSVRPFQLMMGKIIGIALVGLTQFLLWVILTFTIVSVFQVTYAGDLPRENFTQLVPGQDQFIAQQEIPVTEEKEDVTKILEIIDSIDFGTMVLSFIFYFLFGYLLYAALFAAIGSASDTEVDTQQFMLPVSLPLILSLIIAQFVMRYPDGPVAFWFSIIPFTSPVVMMVRIPFGVPLPELYLSMLLLVLGFLGTTWLAGKIYRTGILMYGKKVNYKE